MFFRIATHRVALVAPAAFAQSPQACEFITGHATVKSIPGQPEKLKQGRAVLTVSSENLTAKLCGADMNGEQSLQLQTK